MKKIMITKPCKNVHVIPEKTTHHETLFKGLIPIIMNAKLPALLVKQFQRPKIKEYSWQRTPMKHLTLSQIDRMHRWTINVMNAATDDRKWWCYLMYLSMNFLWNSDRRASFINPRNLLSSSPLAQFLNTTSSSHLKNMNNMQLLIIIAR